ncbi:RNA polymerase sigma factor [Lentisalinibacter salinarum]|uniref:RNA polymerase sigma factor n=1 Tax=Lentisalinibacter salinarum TaxID=2992239 RepID=UPI003867BE95
MSGFAGISVDEVVIRRARRGEAGAHESLYRALAPAVYTLALRLVKTPAAAEDMLQETFIEVMRSLPGYRGDASLATWVRRIAVNKCLMHLRSAWNRRAGEFGDGDEPVDGGAPVAESVGLRMDLEAALASLPAESRVVVWLHDVEGYTHREIAMVMQKTESYSKSQLSRAHRRLRDLLDGGAGEPGDATSRVTGVLPGG